MKKKNVLLVICSLILVAALSVGITTAYLTDNDEKVNTFTVGNLDIALAEPSWDDTSDGKNMEPGYETEKDPTVTILDGSAYLRMSVEFVATDDAPMTEERVAKIMETIYTGGSQGVNTVVFQKDEQVSTTAKFYYNCEEILEEGESVVLFDTVKIPAEWEKSDFDILGTYKLVIRAEAIQSSTFQNAAEAFAVLNAEA